MKEETLEQIAAWLRLVVIVACYGGVILGVLTKDYAYAAFMMAWLIFLKLED